MNASPNNSTTINRPQLEKHVRTWVNQAFFGTLLKQIHNSPFRSELFSGGRAGQAFSSLLDQHLTERMGASSAARPLVNSIVRQIERSHRGASGK